MQWAQRRRFVLVLIPAPEATDVTVGIEASHISADFKTRGTPKSLATDLFAEVLTDPGTSSWCVVGMGIQIKLVKKIPNAPFWDRLAAKPGKNPNISVYWNAWKDEDEVRDEEEEAEVQAFGKSASPYYIGDGITIGGGGDPDRVAQLLQQAAAADLQQK
eukprot:PhM_4_TR15852/c0_g2_i1/m.80963